MAFKAEIVYRLGGDDRYFLGWFQRPADSRSPSRTLAGHYHHLLDRRPLRGRWCATKAQRGGGHVDTDSMQPCCTRDEGGPLGAAVQAEASNHLKLLWSKAMVVSVKEKVPRDGIR